MEYKAKKAIAESIIEQLGRKELTKEQWNEIKEMHRSLLAPLIVLRTGDSEFFYVEGSPLLKQAVNVLVNTGEEFRVDRVSREELTDEQIAKAK